MEYNPEIKYIELGDPNRTHSISPLTPTKTLRDEIAIAAMQGILTTSAAPYLTRDDIEGKVAENAYSIADAMLKERDRGWA